MYLGMQWEDAAEEEEDWETAEADGAVMSTAVSGIAGSFDVETTEEAGPSRPRRKGITKEDRETARLLHRTHLLCLLSQGLLYDEGANDPLLQATMLSLVPPEIMLPSDICKEVSPPALQPMLSWFQHTFQQLPPALPQSPDEDDFAGKADGLDSVTAQLQAVAVAKQGTAKQLQALFVSLCRAQALLVRSVRVLDPMPLTPGARRVASAHLKQPRRQKPKPDNAATANSASASAAAATHGESVTADVPSKKARGRKRKSAESAETNEVQTSPDASHKTSNAKAAKATKKRGKKAADQLKDGLLDDGKGSTRTQVQHRQPAAKGKRTGSKGAAEKPDEAELQLQDDMAAACAASLVDTQQIDGGAHSAAKAKRVGDIELENQLAMAMASTAAEALHRTQRKPTAKAVHDEPMPSAFSPRSAVPKPTLGETWARDACLANQDLAQSSAASCWAEVFCGSAELGRWVHVDPLLNWLDVPDKVEGAGISVLAADKLRDNAWWEQTLKPLRKHEVAATTLHHKAQQLPAALQEADEHLPGQTAGSDLKNPQGRPPAALTPAAEVSGATCGADDKTSKLAARAAELALKREDAELNQRAVSERRGLPSNVEGFKHHPVYVLERHIGRYFALKPGTKKAGMHRGEGFYPREALAELHTADRWLRDGLEVKSEELAKPYKVVKRRGVKDPPRPHTDPPKGPAEEEDVQEATSVIPVPDSMVTKMYGRWQTQQWEVPTAVGGVVPKNDRGNVHCPPLASELPKGTVHLQMPRLGPICKKLSVDYAPAMTGFDIRGGRSVPVIEGVVVCKEDEATVLEAYIEDERLREERAGERRRQEAHAAWRQLLRSIWTRLRLHRDYGDNAAAHAGQHHAEHALLGVSREDLSGAAEVVDLVEDQPGEAAGPSQQPKGQLKQLQAASPGSDAPQADSQSHDDDDGIHQVGQLNGQAKSPSNKRGMSTRTTQAQPAAAQRQASRQPNGIVQAGDAAAAKNDAGHGNDRYKPTESKVERRSKSGLVVEMEEI
ncbi:MAG: DNA repair complementing XP-C cells-like [Trebouxia sp. A1-2]|nr:MAG: DNA repair complementing XP-C cells-like [Trebouxia sp. A1-2]